MLYHTETIYIDGGSHNAGGIIESWRANGVVLPRLPHYCFEPNPRYKTSYDNQPTTLIPAAIWTENCAMPFYVSRDRGAYGCSLFQNKLTWIKKQLVSYMQPDPIIVPCLDFSHWLLNNISPKVWVVLKLDIEGAEYEVLKKMLRDGSIRLINELYAEFHFDRIGMSRREHIKITEEVRSTGIIFKRWR